MSKTFLTKQVLEDPYEMYSYLRESEPVHWSDQLNGWLITRWVDVVEALRTPEVFSSRRASMLAQRGGKSDADVSWFIDHAKIWMYMLDPPEHTRVRNLMNQGFRPSSVRNYVPLIDGIADRLVTGIETDSRVDLVPSLSFPMPILMLCHLYGLPEADGKLLWQWAEPIKLFLGGTVDVGSTHVEAQHALTEMLSYLGEQIQDRRKNPTDDLISQLVQAEWQGQRLDDDELCANLLNLIGATFETSIDLLSNGILALLQNKAQWQLLKDDPSLIPNAVDELIRYDGPVQSTHRIMATDHMLHGKTMKRGDLVYLVRGAANRDPEKFPDPDTLDVTRDTTGHVGLGHGVHYCIGAGLAKAEGAAALRNLITRVPDLQLDPDRGHAWRADNMQFRGLSTFPVITGL